MVNIPSTVNIPFVGEVSTYIAIGGGVLLAIILLVLLTKEGQRRTQVPQREAPEIFQIVLIVMLLLAGAGLLLQGLGIITLPKIGPLFMLALVVATVAFVFNFITGKQPFSTTKDIVKVVLAVAFIILAFIFLPKVVPQFFSIAADGLRENVGTAVQSIVGGP